jgi:hypothetical protein
MMPKRAFWRFFLLRKRTLIVKVIVACWVVFALWKLFGPRPPPFFVRPVNWVHASERVNVTRNIDVMPILPDYAVCGAPTNTSGTRFRVPYDSNRPASVFTDKQAYSAKSGVDGRVWYLDDMSKALPTALVWRLDAPGMTCCGNQPYSVFSLTDYDDSVCLFENVKFVGTTVEPGAFEKWHSVSSASYPGPIVNFKFELMADNDKAKSLLLANSGGMVDWETRVYSSVSWSSDAVPCDSLTSKRVYVFASETHDGGGFWHAMHNLFMRSFGALADLHDGTITCNVDWAEGCRVQRDRVAFGLAGRYPRCNNAATRYLEPLTDAPVVCGPPVESCYDRVLFGLASSLNFNRPRTTARTAALVHHLSRFMYFRETGRSLPPLYKLAEHNGRTHTAVQPFVVIIVRKVRWRSWEEHHLEKMQQVLLQRNLLFELVSFENKQERVRAWDALRRATLVIGVSGAGLTNLIFIQPGTVVVDIYPRQAFGFPLKKFFIYTSLINAVGGVQINYEDRTSPAQKFDGQVHMNNIRFNQLLDVGLSFGVHTAMSPTWKWSDTMPLYCSIVLPDPDFASKVAASPHFAQWF